MASKLSIVTPSKEHSKLLAKFIERNLAELVEESLGTLTPFYGEIVIEDTDTTANLVIVHIE